MSSEREDDIRRVQIKLNVSIPEERALYEQYMAISRQKRGAWLTAHIIRSWLYMNQLAEIAGLRVLSGEKPLPDDLVDRLLQMRYAKQQADEIQSALDAALPAEDKQEAPDEEEARNTLGTMFGRVRF